jgi:hypothetical protein
MRGADWKSATQQVGNLRYKSENLRSNLGNLRYEGAEQVLGGR